jgi:beta-N-acetylhexosaminidase
MKFFARPNPNSRTKNRIASPSRTKWVEQTLRKMTLREKLGQMLMVTYFGGFTSTESPAYRELRHEIDDNHVGGLILVTSTGPLGIERSRIYPSAILANELQNRSITPLLIGADFESGTAMRLEEGTSFPSAMAIAATGDPRLAYTAGTITALEARAAGIHWVFAPVADVNENPKNPIINIRSFGENPADVSRYVREFVRGVESHGALATAKHFPGHGDVSIDSHLALAVVPGNREELNGTELVPFRAAIRAGVSAIMPGHLAVPSLEPDPKLPATLSHKILSGLLRKEMKFRGLIVTDAMEMGGVATLYPPGEAAVRSVEAGADVLLMPPEPDAAIAALTQAVESGRIPVQRIEESLRRILAAKARLGLDKHRLTDIAEIRGRFGSAEYRAAAQSVADRGVTLLRDSPKLLPLDATRPLRVLLVALSGDPDPCPGAALEPEIRMHADSLTVLRADTRFTPVCTLKLSSLDTYDIAVVALFVRVADRKGHVGFPDDQCAFVNQVIETNKPAVVAAFGSPYLIARFPNAKTWVSEFSTNAVSQRAVARALFGQIVIEGRISVTVPGTLKRGHGIRRAADPMTIKPGPAALCSRLKPAYALLDKAVDQGAFPGGVLAVGLENQLGVHPFGKLSAAPKAPAVIGNTIYDVASLTKPIVTTTAIMLLVQRGQLDLNTPVEAVLPEWTAAAQSDDNPRWRERATVRMLLLHNSGLPAHRDFFQETTGRHAVVARAMAEPLAREPGVKIEYSDLGFMLLGEMVERLTGRPLDLFAKKEIFDPLGMCDSLFNPPRSLRTRIAPTEDDFAYRKRLLRGEVADENAWAMGGVAGHAGLFSTAGDIAVFAQMLLNGGIYTHRRLLARSTIAEFSARQVIGDTTRALGWDVPAPPSMAGRFFSQRSFGHLGFTGTSLWIDPARDLFIIFLTNRIHPSRTNDKIRQVRPALHDCVLRCLGLADEAD